MIIKILSIKKNTDQYFDSYKMTFDKYGNPIFSDEVSMII